MQLQAADLFCGAGGTTEGAHQSGQVKVKLAVNHWRPAVYSHQTNHPEVRHICAEIDRVDPQDFVDMGLNCLLASPECIFHSNARGGRPVDDQRRATAWCVPRWAEVLRPRWIIVENVREFEDWAPLGVDGRPLKSKRGEIFQAWIQTLRALNYHVEWRLLNAADYGGATKRTRLFVVARRGASKQPIRWPAASHSKENWTPAHSIIDWSRPCPSIFGRKRPLAEKTLRRIEIGLRKFCGPSAQPFIVKLRRNETAGSVVEPLNTITCGGHYGLAQPFVVQYHGGIDPKRDGTERQYSMLDPLPTVDTQPRYAVAAPFLVPNFGERDGQEPRTHAVDEPLPTVTSHGAGGLVTPFMIDVHNRRREDTSSGCDEPMPTIVTKPGNSVAMPFLLPRQGYYDCHRDKPARSLEEPLPVITANHGPGHLVVPYLIDVNHGESNRSAGGRVHPVDEPLTTVTTSRGQALCLPFVTEYYSNGGARSVNEPLSAVTTKHRHGLTLVSLMQELGIIDIGFRMLGVDELAAAQGFPRGYHLFGTKAEQIKQVGNSVHTLVARALCEAIGKAG